MGNCFGCCPEDDEAQESDRYDEHAPLLREGGHAHPAHVNGRVHHGSLSCDEDHGLSSCPGGTSHPYYGSQPGGQAWSGRVQDAPKSADQSLMAEVLAETAEEIMDCSEAAHVSGPAAKGAGLGAATSEEAQRELAARAVEYGQRLSSVASSLAQKHLGRWTEGLADLGSPGQTALGESPEAILTDNDQLLVSEVASRAQESLHDISVEDAPAIAVAFGGRRESAGSSAVA